MSPFLSGMIAMGFLVAGLFFFRFWRRTGDALFTYFAVSFWLLALGQAVSIMVGVRSDDRSWIYLVRLAAFVVLIVGIVSKNLERSRAGGSPKGN